MRILIALTYFHPYKSGLTVYAIRQARALAERGHQVTVLTSQYDRSLPREEVQDQVRIIRLPVALRLSKGVIMPRMPFTAWQLIGESDMVNLHVPQLEAAPVALLAKLRRKKVVVTYHCDLKMPRGVIHKLAQWGAAFANRITAGAADVIVHNTRDFAEHSPFLRNYLDKLTVINPPIEVESVTQEDVVSFTKRYNIHPGQRIIGMVARLASEKGVEYLVEAMPSVIEAIPDARVIFAGEYEHVLGEEAYKAGLLPMISELGERWTFTGVLTEAEKSVFYQLCDLVALPSINSTESFGMVQIEAMICGTPVVATDLPGVRQPVTSTGIGRNVPIKDPDALAAGIIDIIRQDVKVAPEIAMGLQESYSPAAIAEAYEKLFREVMKPRG